jgi:hypothetical protein
MSNDLVKRLREVKDWWREPGRTAEQAADRIEALEKALQSLLDVQNGPPLIKYADEWGSAVEAARAALEGKYE